MVMAGEKADQNRGEDKHDEVDNLEAVWSDTAGNGDGECKNDANVEDVAAYDVTN